MTIKLAVLSLVPIAALGLWLGTRTQNEESVPRSAARNDTAAVSGAELEQVSRSEATRSASETVEDAVDAQSSSTGAVPPRRVDAIAVDALTSEPIPDLTVTLSTGPALPAGHPSIGGGSSTPSAPKIDRTVARHRVAAVPAGHSGVSVTTDNQGRIVVEGESDTALADVSSVSVHARDGDAPGRSSIDSGRYDLPLTGPVPFEVGPTYRLVAGVQQDLPWDRFTARIDDGPDRGSWRMKARVRPGAPPWVRLPFAVTQLEGEGPWTLDVADDQGHFVGTGTVTRKVGIEPVPVILTFESFGAVEFHGAGRPGGAVPVGVIEVVAVGASVAEEPRQAHLEVRTPPQRPGEFADHSTATLRRVPPGSYRWKRGSLEGLVKVEVGVTSVVELEPADVETFDAVVAIDATAMPGCDLSSRPFRVMRQDDVFEGVMLCPERDPAGEDRWQLRLSGLALGQWTAYAPDGDPDLDWEPRSVRVVPGELPVTFVARRPSEQVPVHFEVVDDGTGEALPSAEVALNVGGFSYVMLARGPGDALRAHPVPRDATSHAYVRAAGYETELVRFCPDREGREQQVRLRRGWRASVRVMAPAEIEWIEGVEVFADGMSIGRTDEFGEVWCTGDGPPQELTLGDLPDGMEVLRTPGGEAPLMGYVFVVRRE